MSIWKSVRGVLIWFQLHTFSQCGWPTLLPPNYTDPKAQELMGGNEVQVDRHHMQIYFNKIQQFSTLSSLIKHCTLIANRRELYLINYVALDILFKGDCRDFSSEAVNDSSNDSYPTL